MSLAVLYSRALAGMEAPPVTVEVHLANGLPNFTIVGLPEIEVKESKDRVRSALLNCRFEFPARRITVNLAPADLPKESGRFDLPIALGILAASAQIPGDKLGEYEFAGELALTGELRPIRGALAMTYNAHRSGRAFVLPVESATEASLVRDARVYPAATLLQVCAHLAGRKILERATDPPPSLTPVVPDFADVKGQAPAKRALEVAAAGSHSVLMIGPPGTGKTMLAERFAGILPPMTEEEALASAALQSLGSQGFDVRNWKVRPYRAPHHTASAVALVGGGSNPRPGEISMAMHGVLFLDELPEFPARFQLIAAMNPCPCGFLGHYSGKCHCTPDQVTRYRRRISGPLMDRIDLHIEVPAVPEHEIASRQSGEPSAAVCARVSAARDIQLRRQGKPNALLSVKEIESHCIAEPQGQQLARQAITRLGLSARAYHRILKVARTIADLAGADTISAAHVAEAVQYRRFQRI